MLIILYCRNKTYLFVRSFVNILIPLSLSERTRSDSRSESVSCPDSDFDSDSNDSIKKSKNVGQFTIKLSTVVKVCQHTLIISNCCYMYCALTMLFIKALFDVFNHAVSYESSLYQLLYDQLHVFCIIRVVC